MKGKIGAIFLAIVMVVGLFGCLTCLEKIPAGYVGVVYNMNGGVDGEVLTQGWHLVAPSKRVTEYSIGLEQSYLTADEQGDSKNDESFKVPTSDGKSVTVSLEFSYRFDETKVAETFVMFKGKDGETIHVGYVQLSSVFFEARNISDVTHNIRKITDLGDIGQVVHVGSLDGILDFPQDCHDIQKGVALCDTPGLCGADSMSFDHILQESALDLRPFDLLCIALFEQLEHLNDAKKLTLVAEFGEEIELNQDVSLSGIQRGVGVQVFQEIHEVLIHLGLTSASCALRTPL